jgi:hypothetical protein
MEMTASNEAFTGFKQTCVSVHCHTVAAEKANIIGGVVA